MQVYPLCESHKDILAVNHLVGSNVLSGMSAEDYSTNIAECMTHPLQWRVSVITYPWYYCSGRYVRYQLIHLLKIFTNSILRLVWMILLLHYMFYNFYWVLQLLCNPWWIFWLLLAFVLLNNLWYSATHWMSVYKGQKHPLTGKYNSVLWKLSSRILQIWVPIKIDLH